MRKLNEESSIGNSISSENNSLGIHNLSTFFSGEFHYVRGKARKGRYRGSNNANKTCCHLMANTNVLVELLDLKCFLDFEKRSCCRIECLNGGITRNPRFRSSGWSRYPIKLNSFEQEFVKNWHISYHGTTQEAIKSILKDKRLIVPNNRTVHIRKGHIPNQFFIFTSPSLLYASFGLYSAPFKLKSSEKWWQIVVELVQKPGSYIKECETSGLGDYEFDLNIGNDEIEWKSDKEMDNLIKAILVREIENTEPPICQYPIGTFFQHDESWWYQPYDGDTPFCPEKISSSCGCHLQRGTRANGSNCPLNKYLSSKKTKDKQVYTGLGDYPFIYWLKKDQYCNKLPVNLRKLSQFLYINPQDYVSTWNTND
ncbi:neuralized-like protein 4 [Cryptosporidium felis]|nr:neuralized-like protein 4 [Cryptosporidium felis]